MCLIWGREPGCAPGGAVTFSCLAKRKSPKRRRPYCACPFAALRATCDARAGGAPQNSLRACSAPFKQLRRVSARSACVLRHTHAPPALRFSARTEGNPQPDIHTGHRFARPRLRGRKRLALRYPGRTQRWPVWLLGCWAVGLLGCWAVGLLGCWAVRLFGCSAVGLLGCWAATPLLYAPGARRRRGGVGVPQDTPALRQLTRRVCLNGAPQARSELRGAPRIRAPQVAP